MEMKGAGGGSQEISWQRYNGVRRSKFRTGDREYDTQFGEPAPVEDKQIALPPPPPIRRPADMWTEITKDLVIKEAVEHMGYDYEETEFFFYVMEYLKYVSFLKRRLRDARRLTSFRRTFFSSSKSLTRFAVRDVDVFARLNGSAKICMPTPEEPPMTVTITSAK